MLKFGNKRNESSGKAGLKNYWNGAITAWKKQLLGADRNSRVCLLCQGVFASAETAYFSKSSHADPGYLSVFLFLNTWTRYFGDLVKHVRYFRLQRPLFDASEWIFIASPVLRFFNFCSSTLCFTNCTQKSNKALLIRFSLVTYRNRTFNYAGQSNFSLSFLRFLRNVAEIFSRKAIRCLYRWIFEVLAIVAVTN